MPDPPPGLLGGEKTTRCISKAKENTKMQFGEIIRDILEMHHILHAINFSSNLIWGWWRGWDERGRGSGICIKERCAVASLNSGDGGMLVFCCFHQHFSFLSRLSMWPQSVPSFIFLTVYLHWDQSQDMFISVQASGASFAFFKSISTWPLRVQGCVLLNSFQTKKTPLLLSWKPIPVLKGYFLLNDNGLSIDIFHIFTVAKKYIYIFNYKCIIFMWSI